MSDASTAIPTTGRQIRSLVTADGDVELSLADVDVPTPTDDQVLVRIEAAPINPSDLGLLFGGADMAAATASGTAERPVVTAPIAPPVLAAMAGRVGESMAVGNEGGGVVIAAGSSPEAQALLGRTVGVLGGSMYSEYRCVHVSQTLALPDGVTSEQGAACFVNPLTALGMIGTMRREGHTALVHTAAASNLGQMLNRLCLADSIELVNIVRRDEQAQLLRDQGAVHVCNSSSESFLDDLTDALDRDRRHHRLRCHRRRTLGRSDPHRDGTCRQRPRHRIQPLRLERPQAGLHLRRPRSGPDRTQPELRHGMGRRRLAPHPVHDQCRS